MAIITNQMKAQIRARNLEEEKEKSLNTSVATTSFSSRPNVQSSTNWYSGSQPTARETGAQMYRVMGSMKTTKERDELQTLFDAELRNPQGPIYSPYLTANSDKQTQTNLKNTYNAATEWDAYQKELRYWAGRTDRNYSDDEIIGKIDMKKYPTLAKMDEAAAMGTPMAILADIGYSQDAKYGVLWEARNPGQGTGNAFIDAIQGQLGRGNQFKANDVNGLRDATSNSYAPYKAGATALDDLVYKYGLNGDVTLEWLNSPQGRSLQNGDEQSRKDYQRMYDVATSTAAIREEAVRYRADVTSAIEMGEDPSVFFQQEFTKENYPKLYAMYEGQMNDKLVETSGAVDFDIYGDVDAMQQSYLKSNGTMTEDEFNQKMAGLLGIQMPQSKAQSAVTVQTNADLMASGSIFAKDLTPAEKAAFNMFGMGYQPSKQQIVAGIVNGTADEQTAYSSAVDAANQYAAQNYLDAVQKLREYEAQLKAFDAYEAWSAEWQDEVDAYPIGLEHVNEKYAAESKAMQPNIDVWDSYNGDRNALVALVEEERKKLESVMSRYGEAENLNFYGTSANSVMPMLEFIDMFTGYEGGRYAQTEWGAKLASGESWDAVGKDIAKQEYSNAQYIRMINTVIANAEKYGINPEYLNGMVKMRDDLMTEVKLMQYDQLQGNADFGAVVNATVYDQKAKGNSWVAALFFEGDQLLRYQQDSAALETAGQLDQMTEHEKDVFKYLYAKEGAQAAEEYFKTLVPMLNVRASKELEDKAREAAGFDGMAISAMLNIASPIKFIENAAMALFGEQPDPYGSTFAISRYKAATTEETHKQINETYGEGSTAATILNGMYDAASGITDSATAYLAAGGNPFFSRMIMATSAGNSTLMDASLRGGAAWQNWAMTGISMVAETLTEGQAFDNMAAALAKGGTGTFKGLLKNAIITEGLGEGLSELANTVADNVIMQEFSNYNATVQQYRDLGYTEETAKRLAQTDVIGNILYSGVIGAVSAAGQTTGSYALGTAAKKSKNLFKSRAEAALSQAQAPGTGDKNKTAAVAAVLESAGKDSDEADAAASAMVQADPEAAYTLWTILEHSTDFEAIDAVTFAALVPDSQTAAMLNSEVKNGATDENVAAMVQMAKTEMQEPAMRVKYEVGLMNKMEGMASVIAMSGTDMSAIKAAENTARQKGDALQVANMNLKTAKENMKAASRALTNAQARFKNDHGDKATKQLEKNIDRYQKAQQALEPAKQAAETAQREYDEAKSELDKTKQTALIGIRQLAEAGRDQAMARWKEAKEHKAAEAEAKRQEENVLEMEFQNYMAENAPNATPEQEAELRGYFMETMADMQNEPAAAAEEGTIAPEEAQQKAVDAKNQRFTNAISKRFGLKVQFTDQLISGAKGAYNRSTGILYLRSDLSQGEAIFEVALHELTHRAEGGGLAYNAFASSLLDIAYKGDKKKLKAEIRARRDRYNNRFAQIVMSGAVPGNANLKPLSSADAKKELVADLTRKILYGDENLINQLVESSPETAYTFMDWLKDTMKRLVGIKDPMVDRLEHTRSLFEAALNKAGQRPVQDGAHPNAMQFSIEQFARASGFSTVRTDGGVPYAIVDDDGNEVTKVTPEMIQNAPVGRLVQSALRNGTIDEATANAQYGMLSDLMTMICEYKDQAMIWELAGSELFSAIKSNSDAQYGTTVDFGTICSKTREVVNVMSETMLREGRGLTRDEVIEAYRQTHNVGLAVPCPVCYVFSRWMGVPSLLETMRKGQERFANATDEQVNEYLRSVEGKYAAGDAKVSTAVASAKGRLTAKLDKIADQMMKSSLTGADVSELENQARMLEAELDDIELYNWVRQVLCKTDSKRNPILDANGNVTIDPNYTPVPNEILLDLRRTGEFASEYGKSWTFRTTRGAGMGKAILPYSGAELGDSVAGVRRWTAGQNPFFTGDDKVADRKLKNARVRMRSQNLIGGQRFQSTSDYRPEWGLDYLTTFLEMQAIGAKGQLYTKVIEAVDMYATAGIEVNLSIMAKGNGYHVENGKNVLGVEDFSSVTGIDFAEAYEKTKKYDNVQMILVGLNDEHIRAAMADDRITFIIPWHASGNSKTTLANLMNAVGESAGEATDYSKTQTDKVENQTPEQKAAWDLRSAILTGKLKKGVSTEQQAILDSNPYLAALYDKFYVDTTSEAYGVKLSAKQAGQIFPHEYWDTSSTIENADENGRRFVEYCESMGVTPRFSQFKDDAGYWKLLIDRRMYNRDGSYHHPKQIDVTNVKIESVAPEVSQAKVGTREQITEAAQRTIDEIRARVPEKPFDMTVEGVDLSDAQYSLAEDEADGEPGQAMSSDPEVQKENMRAWMNRQGQRQFAGQTVQNSSAVPEEHKPTFMLPENLFYEKDTNREQVERAWQRIQQNGFEAEYNRLLEKEDVYDADDTAEANLMMAMALNPNTSDPAVFMSLALRYNEKGTENAQALQARQLFKKMTPTGAQVWVAGKAEKDLKERRRTHRPEAKMVDTAAETVKANVLRLTDGSDNTQMDSDNRWSIPLNPQQKALIDQYGLSEVNRPGLFYNRATVKQRMLEAIIATPNPLEVTGLGLNLIQRLEYMKKGKAVITNADLNYIGARMGEFVGAGGEAGGRVADIALGRAYEAYANINPASAMEKFRAQRYVNMLLSLPSFTRNIIGNAGQNLMNAAAHGVAVEIDKRMAKKTGIRTLDHLTVEERRAGWETFVEETKNTFNDFFVDKVNTAPNRDKYSTNNRGRVFQNGIQEGMRNMENFLMSVGDRNVWKKAYVNSLAEQQRLADQGLLFNPDGTTMTHEQMVEQAEHDANYATFTEDTMVQEMMGALAAKHPVIADLISVYLPFTGVPTNIIKRSLQFSPMGFAKVATNMVVNHVTGRNVDQKGMANDIGRALTGTGLLAAGVLLGMLGVIKMGTEDEDGNKAYDAATALGHQYTPYVFDPITGTNVSMSTFAPALSPLVWGAAAWDALDGDEDAGNALLNALFYSTDSIFNASYLSGFSDLFGGQGSFTERLFETGASNVASQLIPAWSTQLANALDPYVRNTKDKNHLVEIMNNTINKIPILRTMLPEKVTVAGENVETKGFWGFVDPFTRTNPSHNAALNEAYRLYELFGSTDLLPSDLLRSRTNTLNVGGGKKLILENHDKEWYQKRYGELWTTALMELMNSPKYARMDDDERAEALKKILSDAMSQAKKEAWAKYGEE